MEYDNEEPIQFSEDLYFQLLPASFSKSQPKPFVVRVTNNGEEALPANSKVVLENIPKFCDQHVALLEDPLEVGDSVDVDFVLRPKYSSFRGVPEHMIFRVGEKYYQSPLEMRFFFSFFDDLPVEESGAAQLNILLLGLAGATKSSFVNSVYTLFSDGLHPIAPATSGSTQTHVTKNLTRYQVRPNISLWDMWGLTQHNYEDVQKLLPMIFEGRLPSGWDMKDDVNNHKQEIEKNSGSSEKRRIHATILFVPQSLVNDPNLIAQRTALINLKTYLENKFKMEVLVLLTKMDEVDPAIREDPFAEHSVQAAKEQVAEDFNVREAHVFYNLNYTGEDRRTFQLDKLNFIILEQASRFALEFLRKRAAKSPMK